MAEARARVLVAVEPVVLEGAFAAILELIGLDEVVQFHEATPAERGARYGAAVVSTDLAAAVSAAVVITLPGTVGDSGATAARRGHLTSGQVSRSVDIRSEREVVDLLDEHVPRRTSRRDGLLAVQRRPPA